MEEVGKYMKTHETLKALSLLPSRLHWNESSHSWLHFRRLDPFEKLKFDLRTFFGEHLSTQLAIRISALLATQMAAHK